MWPLSRNYHVFSKKGRCENPPSSFKRYKRDWFAYPRHSQWVSLVSWRSTLLSFYCSMFSTSMKKPTLWTMANWMKRHPWTAHFREILIRDQASLPKKARSMNLRRTRTLRSSRQQPTVRSKEPEEDADITNGITTNVVFGLVYIEICALLITGSLLFTGYRKRKGIMGNCMCIGQLCYAAQI